MERFIATIEPAESQRLTDILFDEFRTLGQIFAQTPEALERVLGRSSPVARMLLGARDMVLEGLKADLSAEPIDPHCPKLRQYLIASMGSLPEEVLRVLFLNSAGALVADELLQFGSLRQLMLYPRTIFRRAMELNAAGLILVHNHPAGDATPSDEDLQSTEMLVGVARALDVEIVDHIIVSATRTHHILGSRSAATSRNTTNVPLLKDLRRPGGGPSPNRSTALENAKRTARRRTYRQQLIGAQHLFGEPAWDMLIDLFMHQYEGKRVSTSALCVGACIPSSSALRLLHKLCEAGIIKRTADPNDGRRQFVELMPDISERLERYFSRDEL